jgi:hypothetical protein
MFLSVPSGYTRLFCTPSSKSAGKVSSLAEEDRGWDGKQGNAHLGEDEKRRASAMTVAARSDHGEGSYYGAEIAVNM